MTIEWNNRTYRFNPNGGNSDSSLYEHDRQMREFRRSHADIALVNGPRFDEAAFLESLLIKERVDTPAYADAKKKLENHLDKQFKLDKKMDEEDRLMMGAVAREAVTAEYELELAKGTLELIMLYLVSKYEPLNRIGGDEIDIGGDEDEFPS